MFAASILIAATLTSGQPAGNSGHSPIELVEAREISSVAVSPNGAFASFRVERASVQRNEYRSAWFVLDLDGSNRVREVADGGVPLRDDVGSIAPEPPIWSQDSRWIYFRALLDGEVQIWRASRSGSSVEQVTFEAADVEQFSLADDGSRLQFAIGAPREEIIRAEEREYDEGIMIDGSIDPWQGLYRAAFINGRLATQRLSGNWWDRHGLLGDRARQLRMVDLSDPSRESTLIEAGGGGLRESLAQTTSETSFNGQFTAALQADGTGTRVVVVDRSGQEVSSSCNSDRDCLPVSVAAMAWRPGTSELLLWENDRPRGGVQNLIGWDLATGEVRVIVETDGLISGDWTGRAPCGLSNALAVCVASEAGAAPRVEVIELDDGSRTVAYAPNAVGGAGPFKVELLAWSDGEGRRFTGQYFPAAGRTRAPLFLNYGNCRGFIRGGTGEEFPFAALANAGIAALCINAAPYAADSYSAVGAYRVAQSAVESAVSFLERRGDIDRSRIGMGGFSFGSEVTLWLAVNTDLLVAASSASAQPSPMTYWVNSVPGRDYRDVMESAWGVRSPEETPDQWLVVSPAMNTDRIRAALLLQLPEQEYLRGIELFSRLANRSAPVEMYAFPHEPHKKFLPRHKYHAYQRNLDWFRFWLLDEEDDDPSKIRQYERWRQMRDNQAARTEDVARR